MIAVVPARGGSQEVKRKNLAVVDGKPLLCHIADTLKQMGIRVIVSTEDPEIASVAKVHGYEVHARSMGAAADDVPVSVVAQEVVDTLQYEGPVIIAQPTCPFVTQETLARLINRLSPHHAVTLATPNTHILRDHGRRSEAVNRQDMSDHLMHEVGVRVFATGVSFDHVPNDVIEVEGREAYDIDTIHELRAAQATPKTVNIEVTGNEQVGSGHVYRGLALANELQHHDIVFTPVDSEPWVHDRITTAGWTLRELNWPPTDLVIVDRLDTTTEQVAKHKANGSVVVTVEDQGPGAGLADLVVNALYGSGVDRYKGWNVVYGPDWADLRPEFVGLPDYRITDDKRVLCMFGGTDPSHLGERVAKTLAGFYDITVIPPHGTVEVAYEMMNHDVLVTSAGRTVYEAAAVGIPTVVIAQNSRESTHAHLGVGNLYLGVGSVVTNEQIQDTVRGLMGDFTLREDLSDTGRASVDGKGLQRIAWRIEGLLM